jgi:hypothetical protein
MKKLLPALLLAILLAFFLAACKNEQAADEPGQEPVQAEPDSAEPEYTATLYVDFTCGGSDLALEQFELGYDGDLTPEILLTGLSDLTGLDFVADIVQAERGIEVDWKKESTLIANLDDREQNEHFFFYDADSMRWFMMDSLYRTLLENFRPPEVYYTMDGGKALAFDELYPAGTFGLDMPYMGSSFYFANDGKGDIVGDGENVSWLGSYLNASETKTLVIANFNGSSFEFSLAAMDTSELSDVAAVDGDVAYYMDLIFAISIRGNDVSIWMDEPQIDSFNRKPFVDTYFRVEN